MRKRWLIRGLILLGILAAAYTGYWFWLARTFEQQLALWIGQQRAMGHRISYTASESHGYPIAVRIALSNVAVDSSAGNQPWRLDMPATDLSIAPWNPLRLRIDDEEGGPPSQLEWRSAGRTQRASLRDVHAAIQLTAESGPSSITVDAQSIEFEPSAQDSVTISLVSGQVDLFHEALPTESSVEFHFEAWQVDLNAGSGAQPVFKEMYLPLLKGRIVGTIPPRPLPEALAAWSSQGGYLDLTDFSLDISPPLFEGSATLALDARLQPIGAGSVALRDFNQAVDWAAAEGLVTATEATATKLWLNSRAVNDGGELKASFPITIQDGIVSMGPVKLAQLPPIRW